MAKKSTFEKLQEAILKGDTAASQKLLVKYKAEQEKGVVPKASPKVEVSSDPNEEEDISKKHPISIHVPNRFKPEQYVVEKDVEAASRTLAEQNIRITPREKISKRSISCEKCQRPFKVFPSAIKQRLDDNNKTQEYYRCNKCSMQPN